MSLKKAVACIKKSSSFLITVHKNPEGDALGSELAFCRLLEKMGKTHIIINDDDLPYRYNFLPGVRKIKKFDKALKNVRFDCLVVLDCSLLSRCGEVARLNSGNKPILNIDHHISNNSFGDINWVDCHSSSTSEMIYRLYKELRIPLDKYAATLLYVGMLTDTGSFHYANTSSFTHKAASELLKYKLDIAHIYRQACGNVPFEEMELLGKILLTVKRDSSGKIAWVYIKRPVLKKGLSFDLSEYVLSFVRAIKDVELAILFKENLKNKDEVRVNFRSQGKVDVNRIAALFAGGGHKTASGATIKGSLKNVIRKVLSKARKRVK